MLDEAPLPDEVLLLGGEPTDDLLDDNLSLVDDLPDDLLLGNDGTKELLAEDLPRPILEELETSLLPADDILLLSVLTLGAAGGGGVKAGARAAMRAGAGAWTGAGTGAGAGAPTP